MVRRPVQMISFLLAGPLLVGAAAAHPVVGAAGRHVPAPAVITHSDGAGFGPSNAPGNFGLAGQSPNPLANIDFSRGERIQIKPADIEDRSDVRPARARGHAVVKARLSRRR